MGNYLYWSGNLLRGNDMLAVIEDKNNEFETLLEMESKRPFFPILSYYPLRDILLSRLVKIPLENKQVLIERSSKFGQPHLTSVLLGTKWSYRVENLMCFMKTFSFIYLLSLVMSTVISGKLSLKILSPHH